MHINSALVSAQNRQRFYAFNWNIDQPADRGIMLKDILETTTSEKGYELRAPAVGVGCRNRREDDGKLYRRFETSGVPKANALTTVQTDSMVAEPIRIGTIENNAKKQSHDSKQYRVYSPRRESNDPVRRRRRARCKNRTLRRTSKSRHHAKRGRKDHWRTSPQDLRRERQSCGTMRQTQRRRP